MYLDAVVKEGLPEEVTLKLRPKSEKSQICAHVGDLPARPREQWCKGLEVDCAGYVQGTVEARLTGVEVEVVRGLDCGGSQ